LRLTQKTTAEKKSFRAKIPVVDPKPVFLILDIDYGVVWLDAIAVDFEQWTELGADLHMIKDTFIRPAFRHMASGTSIYEANSTMISSINRLNKNRGVAASLFTVCQE